MSRKLEDTRLGGPVGGHGGQGLQAWHAGSAGLAGQVKLGGKAGSGQDRQDGAIGAGRVGQERAGPGRSSCERTYEWVLEMYVPSELARGIKLATILDT